MDNVISKTISENLKFLRREHCYNFVDGIPGDKLYNANETHSFNNESKVYLLMDAAYFIHNCKVSLAITDECVSFTWGDSFEGFSRAIALWGYFERMEVYQVNGLLHPSWIVSGDREWAYLTISEEDKVHFVNIFRLINEINKKIKSDEKLLFDKLIELSDKDKFDEFISLIDESLTMPYYDKLELFRYRICGLMESGDYEAALQSVSDVWQYVSLRFGNETNNWNDPLKEYYSAILELTAICEKEIGNIYPAIFSISNSLAFACEIDSRKEELRNECYDTYKNFFLDIPTKERKVVFISNQFTDQMPSQFLFLLSDNLPDLKFEMNHPQNNELYVIHPFKNDVYYHIGKFDEIMFQDKLMELNQILQCLGAKSIKLMKMESHLEKTKSTDNLSASANVSGLINSADAQIKMGNESNSENKMLRKMISEQQFEPDQSPHLPDDSFWFNHEIVWQKLADQRLNGNITKSIISMSSQSSEFLTSTERKEILAEFKFLILKIKGSYESHSYLEKFLEEANEWSIEVEFAPKNQLASRVETKLIGKNNDDLSKNEKDFEEFILDCLGDGNITEDERRLIERTRAKLNIAEERAKQIEEQVIKFGNANESEREYLDELEFCHSSGGLISEDERRILERLRIKLQISEERAKELEERLNRF